MANEDHIKTLLQGCRIWNAWRTKEPLVKPDLRNADLRNADLMDANLSRAELSGAELSGANLSGANLSGAELSGANLSVAELSGANLNEAELSGANLNEADLRWANLSEAILSGANLSEANLRWANLSGADLMKANLSNANLGGANLSEAYLLGANLSGSDLRYVNLVEAELTDANLTGSRIYGISAWGLMLSKGTQQQDLVITRNNEPEITIDNIEVAQFVYLLLHNEKIRGVIDTIGRRAVLLLGRFTGGRIAILERLREELRTRGFVPIVFNFDKPETKDFTETVRLLAGLSHFVIVDITNPRSAPLELQAIVPECMVP